MEEAVRDMTSLGSAAVLIFITAVVIFYLMIAAGRRPPCSFSLRSPAASC